MSKHQKSALKKHTKRLFHNEQGAIEKSDAGIFFLNLDRNSPNVIRNYVKDISKANKPLEEDCKNYLLCGLPLSHSKMVQIVQYSTWIPANEPVIPEPLTFKLNSKEEINSTLIRYNVSCSGPDRIVIYLSPKNNTKVLGLSLIESLKQPEYSHDNKQLFFILHNYGKDPADLTFTFDVEVSLNYKGTTVHVAITATYVHDKEFVKTPYFLNLLKQFPDWIDVTPWLAMYSSYII